MHRIPWDKVVLAVLVVLGLAAAAENVSDRPPDGDGKDYVLYGYNLVRHGTFSHDDAAGGVPAPDDMREPAYPLYLAAGLGALADVDALPPDCLLRRGGGCDDLRRWLKLSQIPILLAILALVYTASRRLTGRLWLPVLAVALVLFQQGLSDHVSRFRSELVASLFLLGHAYASAGMATAARKGAWAAASGLSLGLLILTKAMYLFYPVVLVVALAGGALWRGFRRAVPLRPAAVAIAIAVVVTAGWFARNAVVLDRLQIAGRGDGLLAIRAEHTTMSWTELAAGFVYFAPFVGRRLSADFLEPAQYERLNWRDLDGYQKRAARRTGEVERVQRSMAGRPFANYLAPLKVMAENWPKQIALTGLMLYRGLAVENKRGRQVGRPLVSLSNLSIVVSVTIIPALLVAAVVAVRRRDAAVIAFLAPAVYGILFLAVLTHFIPRYSLPFAPIGAVALSWLVGVLLERRPGGGAAAGGAG